VSTNLWVRVHVQGLGMGSCRGAGDAAGTPKCEIWRWLTVDPKEFGGVKLPVVLDTQNLCAYRKADGRWRTRGWAAMPLWAGLAAFGVVTALFSILHWAG
jgi:hypothetical protein